jgi:hypothetical protein
MEKTDYDNLEIPKDFGAGTHQHQTGEELEATRKAVLAQYQLGTITWYEIAKGELPFIREGEEKIEIDLLAWSPGKSVALAKYNFTNREMFHEINWQPTHWAYINYPNH